MTEFPVDSLPEPIKDYVLAAANSLDCDTASVALPVLSVLASAIGGQQRIELKLNWSEPATLWTAVLSDKNREALKAATAPLDSLQHRLFHELKSQTYGAGLPTPPKRPTEGLHSSDSSERTNATVHQFVAKHWHLPSLLKTLARQDRGLLLCTDQLDAWLGTGRATARRSIDLATWQDLHAGNQLLAPTTPKQSPQPIIQKSLCLTGLLNPSAIVTRLSKSRTLCPLVTRTLIAMPHQRPRRWTDDEIQDGDAEAYRRTVERLIDFNNTDHSAITVLSDEARQLFASFMTDFNKTHFDQSEALAPWLTNIPTQAARLALITHLARWADDDTIDPNICDATSMQMAINLANWFTNEGVRAISQLTFAADQKDHQHIIDWMLRHGGKVTARDLSRAMGHKYPTSELATKALEELTYANLAFAVCVDSTEKGGRPYRVFILGTKPIPEPIKKLMAAEEKKREEESLKCMRERFAAAAAQRKLDLEKLLAQKAKLGCVQSEERTNPATEVKETLPED